MSSLLSAITPYLPQYDGLLPKWLLFVSVVSIGNSIQAYLTLSFTSRIYSENPSSNKAAIAYPHPLAPHTTVTPLSARTFGTWTLVQSIVRLYAAYNISNPQFYQIAFLTYVVAGLHFFGEWLVFKTARWGSPLAGPIIVASTSMVWMALQWGYYVK